MNKTPVIKVGIAGMGTVGTAVVKILQGDNVALYNQSPVTLKVTQVAVRDLNKKREVDLSDVVVTDNVEALAANEDLDIIVELMGDVDASLRLARATLEKGKPFVTANKAMLALHSKTLFELAKKHNAPLLYEAAVAGGIPIIKVLRESLPANRVNHLCGIVNGTSNYMLSRMAKEDSPYQTILEDAQKLGYAEAVPTFDIEGIDAAHKLCLLGQLIFNKWIDFDDVYHQGISHIQPEDFDYADRLDYVIKPLAITEQRSSGGEIELYVFPALVPKHLTIACVNENLNAVQLIGDHVGTLTLIGQGAGGSPTASSVIADLVEIARSIAHGCDILSPPLVLSDRVSVLPFDETSHAYYLRLQAKDQPKVLQHCTQILSDSGISVEAIIQDEPLESHPFATIVIITNEVQEKVMQQAVDSMLQNPMFSRSCTLLRLLSRKHVSPLNHD